MMPVARPIRKGPTTSFKVSVRYAPGSPTLNERQIRNAIRDYSPNVEIQGIGIIPDLPPKR